MALSARRRPVPQKSGQQKQVGRKSARKQEPEANWDFLILPNYCVHGVPGLTMRS
jgi:hypothetical protein